MTFFLSAFGFSRPALVCRRRFSSLFLRESSISRLSELAFLIETGTCRRL